MDVSDHIHKSHNKSYLLYHFVCPIKYRRKVLTESVGNTLKEICLGISERYEIHFLEIGSDLGPIHFLVQSVRVISSKQIINKIKSLTAWEFFRLHPEVKKLLWERSFGQMVTM